MNTEQQSAFVKRLVHPTRRTDYCHPAADVKDPVKEFIEPAVQGTKNVLSAAIKSKDTVKRVIVTSSFAGAIAPCSLLS